jgi:sterol desaturase/sphingolipid hydroxylase (fatty acid hydroxylase superfamily)
VSLLWRLHKTHHTDHEFDFTTGLRFHPIDSIVTTALGLLAIAAIGAPPMGVLVFQVLTLASALFEHSNLRMPAAVDGILRYVVVTPDVHRVHHSSVRREAQSNLGSIFPWWDRLFGTYVAAPSHGHDQIAFGVKGFSDIRYQQLHWLLLTPFLSPERPPAPQPPAATIDDTLNPLAPSR